MEALLGLFAASFAAATLFPLPSEAALFAYLQHYPDNAVLAVSVATVGNTAGGMTSYLIGRFIHRAEARFQGQFSTCGATVRRSPCSRGCRSSAMRSASPPAGCGSIGPPALGFMAAGRLLRYIVVAALS